MNDNGDVCGIICSSLPSENLNTEHVCYAATLWPLMGLAIDISTNGEPQDSAYPFLDLARDNVITAIGWEQVVARETSTAGLYEVLLRAV